MADVDGSDSSTATSVILEGHLKKQGKFSTKWYHCFAKLEKDCFVYKRNDKVKTKLVLLVDISLEHREEKDCIFTIIDSKKKNKRLVFKTHTPVECKQWLEALFEAVLESKQNSNQQDRSEACSIQ